MWILIAFQCLMILSPILCAFNRTQSASMSGREPNNTDIEMNPFQRIGTKYYYIERHRRYNWFDTVHMCRRINAHLAFIETASELSALSDYLQKNIDGDAHWFWISGNDLAHENHFYSIATGQLLSFTDWSEGQPDNKGGFEDCVHLWFQEGSYKMNDWRCEELAYHICQLSNPRSMVFTVW